MSPAAVQEALLLAMIRLSTVEGINLDVSMKSIRSLQHSTRRRIRERCLQYLDHMANLPKLTAKATESIPEILHGSSSFAFHPPPFLSRNKSPPSSPATSPRRVILPTPRSPDPGTPIRGSPASRTIQLQATRGTQDSVIGFDINWDRLGAQAGLTSRGWFEGSTDKLLRKFEGNKGILRVETVSQDGTGKTFYSYKPPPNHE
ncbi:hypothetical protein FRC15_011414 [Serendipita sp. 397]|nr:hypothetical protein FRC15_011414 [Serendipita sp. 397]